MKYRTLDEDGDYTFGRNKFLRDVEAVGQAIVTRMKLLYSEWWENTDDGLPLFEKILGAFMGEQRKNAVDLIIGERISGTQGVTNIVRFESFFNSDTRVYSAQCTINTIYGTVNLDVKENGRRIEVG